MRTYRSNVTALRMESVSPALGVSPPSPSAQQSSCDLHRQLSGEGRLDRVDTYFQSNRHKVVRTLAELQTVCVIVRGDALRKNRNVDAAAPRSVATSGSIDPGPDPHAETRIRTYTSGPSERFWASTETERLESRHSAPGIRSWSFPPNCWEWAPGRCASWNRS